MTVGKSDDLSLLDVATIRFDQGRFDEASAEAFVQALCSRYCRHDDDERDAAKRMIPRQPTCCGAMEMSLKTWRLAMIVQHTERG